MASIFSRSTSLSLNHLLNFLFLLRCPLLGRARDSLQTRQLIFHLRQLCPTGNFFFSPPHFRLFSQTHQLKRDLIKPFSLPPLSSPLCAISPVSPSRLQRMEQIRESIQCNHDKWVSWLERVFCFSFLSARGADGKSQMNQSNVVALSNGGGQMMTEWMDRQMGGEDALLRLQMCVSLHMYVCYRDGWLKDWMQGQVGVCMCGWAVGWQRGGCANLGAVRADGRWEGPQAASDGFAAREGWILSYFWKQGSEISEEKRDGSRIFFFFTAGSITAETQFW